MTATGVLLLGTFAGLMICGIPFAFTIAIASVLVVLYQGMEPAFFAAQVISGSQSFSLLAVPLFMLAGGLMSASGMTARLIDVANVMVRHRTGGLAMVVVVAAMIFGSISGSAPATTAAIGALMLPALVTAGYDKAFSTAIIISAGVLGPLIPPSIAFVIWGIIAEQSIPKLFLSGIVPGLTIAAGLLVICYFHAWRRGMPRAERATFDEAKMALWHGKWALLSPVIVLGGIYGGIFTPTESAGISCIYTLIVGLLIERKLALKSLPDIFLGGARISGVVLSIVLVSTVFGVLVAQERIAVNLATYMSQVLTEKWMALAAVNIFIFLLCTVMDEVAIMLILGPVLISIANQYGVDPVHFGAVIVTNVSLGMATPPVGYCVFMGMAISGLGLWQISKALWPMIIVMVIVLFMTTYIPGFALLLAGS